MSENALTVIRRKVRAFCFDHTRAGKVGRLESLTKSLSSNTALVQTKYSELRVVEQEVCNTLEQLQSETFEKENKEIDGLHLVNEEDREKFKNALVLIKERGIAELAPISETAQRIKAHMLVTLNKANIQKAILLAKSKLAGNASLQLETLRLIEKETKGINLELRDLLIELDSLNEGAINKYTTFQKDMKSVVSEDTDVIGHIINKFSEQENKKKKPEEAGKKK